MEIQAVGRRGLCTVLGCPRAGVGVTAVEPESGKGPPKSCRLALILGLTLGVPSAPSCQPEGHTERSQHLPLGLSGS